MAPMMAAIGPSPILEATGPSRTIWSCHGQRLKVRKKKREAEYKETRVCRQCGCHGHIEHWHVSKEGRARPMPSRWWASSMYALIDALNVGTDHQSYDDDDDDDDNDDVSPQTSSLVHRITIALRPEWSEPPHGGNWSSQVIEATGLCPQAAGLSPPTELSISAF
jgi:hypothetical protein